MSKLSKIWIVWLRNNETLTATLPILGQNRSKHRQLEAPSEPIPPFNFHPLGSSIAWAPKPQSCCPNIGANGSETNPPPPNSGLFLPSKQPIDRPHRAKSAVQNTDKASPQH